MHTVCDIALSSYEASKDCLCNILNAFYIIAIFAVIDVSAK